MEAAARKRERMWLIRQTREQQGRGFIGSLEWKANMENMSNTRTMNNKGIRGNIGIGNTGNMGQMGPRYKIVLLSDNDVEKIMRHYDGKQSGRDGQGLKSEDAVYKKRSGSERSGDGKIRILKRENDLSLKRKVDGRIRILRREIW